MARMPIRTRPLAAATAVLALGAGSGATAAFLVRAPAGHTTTVTESAGSPRVVSDMTTGASPTVNDIYRRTRQSVVDIKTGRGEGSGFVLNSDGDVVTN